MIAPEMAVVASAMATAVRVGLGLLFLHAAVGKLRGGAFEGVVAAYDLTPAWAVAPIARALPIVELALGAGLVAGLWRAPLAVAAATLLLIFALAMTLNLRRGRRHISCGCSFSDREGAISYGLVVRNLALATLATVGAAPLVDLDPPTLIASGVSGGLLFLAYLAINLVLDLPARNAGRARAAWTLS